MRQSFRINTLPVVLAVLVAGAAHVVALNIAACNIANNGTVIEQTRADCTYPFIFCNLADSQYCDTRERCNASYTCGEVVPDSSSTSTTTVSTTSTPNLSGSTTTVSPLDVRAECRSGVTKKYKYPNNCTYYYYCIDGFLMVEMCPIGYAFVEQSSSCSARVTDVVACRGS